ncbi:exocyst complex subunit Sec6 [Encephalitozoon intestinalis ATCC 50506]|uniref:Exocyst complex subunit Sec6 n=1 Tax=Encephalitozoon intestinalis (strain ATCC 50506) TaxID=876142 RepID=E0SA99_ENCIT|nr:exocyst complex subunit Sec6 [Encephalitozoon intestinalis ATCC 50506]ADM12524.1 exocyst complex subunit Sec6 [Encephalitozoon intestinalis ATCC 50506]UTX46377.1 exocyst complex subunit Sec6 [Encephalitozoon intestinalis]
MDKALSQLSETLRHPSDLQTKLESIERSTRETYERHDQNLTGMISRCYSSILNISKRIYALEEHLKDFVENKDRNVRVLEDFFSLVKDYRSVKMICLAHSNLCRVIEFSDKLKGIEDPVESEDIVAYHTKVYDSEDFGCQLDMYNAGISHDDYIEVNKALNTIEKNSLDFTAKVLEVCEEFIENHEIMGKIVQIVEKEESRDELTRKVQKGEKSDDPVLKELYRMYKMYATRKPKMLKDKVVKSIKVSVKTKFDKLENEEIFVNKMDFVLNDLSFIKENIKLSFYPFDDILMLYHNNLKDFLDRNTERLDAGEILAIVEYVGNYYDTIESKFNKIADALGKRLLGNETELLEKYTRTAQEKLREWIMNISKIEVEKFYARSEELARDEEDKLVSPGFVSLLQIIRMQLEPIAFNNRIFAHITRTITKYCEMFKEHLVEAMDKDFKPSCEMNSKVGYEDFCIMFGNSGLKIAQYITSLPSYHNDEVKELGDIFIDILKASNTFLSEFIIYSCQPAIDKIFTDEWYRGNITKIVVLTLQDFLSDYQNTMSEYSFVTFIHELSTSIVLAYMKQLGRKRATIAEECNKVLKSDHTKLYELLSGYGDKEDVKTCLSPILKVIPLMDTRNDDLFIVEVKSLKLIYPDIKRSFIKTIIKKRQDLTEDQKKTLTDRLKECFVEEASKEKTIFSRLLNL